MQRLERLPADRRQPQAALMADALRTLQCFFRMAGVVMSMSTGAVIMAGMIFRGMIVGIWLHFGRVALRHSIGQPAVTRRGKGILPAHAEPKHFFPDCQEP
jgi:hypothetical protein